ncbi:MAG: hypothetical protein FWG68_04285 [Defluviitaleaceae bacterium]|nr:hypothetical protein [Defluviitaleaceae bacterium]
MKKLGNIAVLLTCTLMFGVFTGCVPWALGETSSVWTMRVDSGMNEERTLTNWEITANSLRGNGRRDISVTATQLAAMHVQSSLTSGAITMSLTQGEFVQILDLHDGLDDKVGNILLPDMFSLFLPGELRLELYFDRTENVAVSVDWE